MSYLSRRVRVVKNADGTTKSEVEQYYAITSFWVKEQKKRSKSQVYIGRKSSKDGYSFNKTLFSGLNSLRVQILNKLTMNLPKATLFRSSLR